MSTEKIDIGEGWFRIDPDPEGPDWPKRASDEYWNAFFEKWYPVDHVKDGFWSKRVYRRRIEPTMPHPGHGWCWLSRGERIGNGDQYRIGQKSDKFYPVEEDGGYVGELAYYDFIIRRRIDTIEQRPERVEGESEFWTSEIPKEHGWYFWRIAHWAKTTFECVMVHISEEAGDTTYFERIGQHKGLPLDYHGNDSLWHGPLTIGTIHGTGLSAPEKPREEKPCQPSSQAAKIQSSSGDEPEKPKEVLPPAASSDAYGFEEWWNHWIDEDDPALTSAARVEKWAKVASKDAYTFQQTKIDALQSELNKANAQLEEAKKKRRELEAQNIERTRHINKVATWASQDITGPWNKLEIQQWILNELAMALGGQPMTHSAWKPEAIKYGEQLSTALQRIEELEKEREPHYIEELIFARKVISELKPKLSDAENVIRVKDDALSKMEAELSTLRDRISALEPELARYKQAIIDLHKETEENDAQIEALEADGRRFKETLRAGDDYIEGLEMVGGAGLPRTERQILKQKWAKYRELKATNTKALSASADAPQDLKEGQK